ncbi:MAG: protein phosphatase 2C domain-containing protein, partial [Thermoguttaceae bacterium]|nr:protein phosphatase 2C domain-containing protein [Thermoguttaceae bacterium]
LNCEIERGVLRVSGAGDDGKPTSSFDGAVEIKLTAKLEFRLGADQLIQKVFNFNRPKAFPAQTHFKDLALTPKPFYITPDPRSMWKDLPTDETAPFQKANSASQGGALADGLVVIAASERGRSHANEGKFRDDHFLIETGPDANGWLFFAVADGAGSAKYSREGSKLACEKTYEKLRAYLSEYNVSFDEAVCKEFEAKTDWKSNPSCDAKAIERTNVGQFFYGAVYDAWNAIKESANEHEAKTADYSTTFLCAAAKRFPAKETRPAFWAVASYWVGDGGAAVYRPNGTSKVHTLGLPDGGEFAGQTRFLTMNDEINPEKVAARVQLNFFDDFQALVLMTDGISDPFFPAETNFTDKNKWKFFWDEILPKEFPNALDASKTPEERADALLKGMSFFRDGNHDDRTLLLVVNDRFEPKPEEESDEEPAPEPSPAEEPDPTETQFELAEEIEQESPATPGASSEEEPDGTVEDSDLIGNDDDSVEDSDLIDPSSKVESDGAADAATP